MGKKREEEYQIIGKKYGELTILGYSEKKGNKGKSFVYCVCDCGNKKEVLFTNLKAGTVQSCGCKRKRNFLKHGKSGTKLYAIYNGMKQRCYCKTSKEYKNYGGRGISLCDEWLNSFESFEKWAYSVGFDENKNRNEQSIDRIDVNGNYCPENCKLSTIKEQARNKTNTIRYELNGEKLTLSEISEKYGVDLKKLNSRVYALGYNIEKAILNKKMPTNPNVKKYEFDGRCLTLTEWSKLLDVPRATLQSRLKSGRSYDKVFTKQKDIHVKKDFLC